jgi:hypothetical protein
VSKKALALAARALLGGVTGPIIGAVETRRARLGAAARCEAAFHFLGGGASPSAARKKKSV